MRACVTGPLYVEYEALTESFHIYTAAEWPAGLVAPPGGVIGQELGLGRVRWHDAEGVPLPSVEATSP